MDLKHWKLSVDGDNLAWLYFDRAGSSTNTFSSEALREKFFGGVEKPIIVLHSALVERLNDEETLAVISHEVGHIHAEHVLYITAARLIEFALNRSVAALLPGAEIIKLVVSLGIASALLAWARRAELSCDRSALLVTQDPHVIGRTMMKLGGGTFASKIDYDLFLEQAREFQKNYDENKLDKFWADIINAGLSHPFPVWRVSEILHDASRFGPRLQEAGLDLVAEGLRRPLHAQVAVDDGDRHGCGAVGRVGDLDPLFRFVIHWFLRW